MGFCNCSMFCCTFLYVPSSFAIILMGKRELVDLLSLSSWRLVMVERLFLTVPRGCLQFVIVVFPDHTHLLFFHRRDAAKSGKFWFSITFFLHSVIKSLKIYIPHEGKTASLLLKLSLLYGPRLVISNNVVFDMCRHRQACADTF